jgi:hypothetical protein
MRFATLLVCAALGMAADTDVTGNWSGKTKTSVNGKVEEDTIYLSLKQTANLITGTAGPSIDQQAPINNGKIEGNHLTFDVPVPGGAFKFDINLEGDHLKGDVVAAAQGQMVKAVMDASRVK